MTKLTPTIYDAAETEGTKLMPNAAIAAFAPVTFQAVMFPTHIAEEESLVRFIDTQHDGGAGKYYGTRHRYSEQERDLISGVVQTVAELSETEFGRKITPWIAPLSAVYPFRIIDALSNVAKRRLSVFEIGPGSGYLGAMLTRAGHKYGSMDNTQSLYLWQSKFYSALAGDDYVELVFEDEGNLDTAKIVHVPWWRFIEFQGSMPISPDIVICDHAIAEMTQHARRYVLQAAKAMIQKDGPKLFLVPSPGGTALSSRQSVLNDFIECGFDLINNVGFHAFTFDNPALSKYVKHDHSNMYSRRTAHRLKRWISTHLSEKLGGKFFTEFCKDANQLQFSPLNGESKFRASDVINVDWREDAPDFKFFDYINLTAPPAGKQSTA